MLNITCSIAGVTKLRILNVMGMDDTRNANEMLVGKPCSKRKRCNKICFFLMYWTKFFWIRIQWWTLLVVGMNMWDPSACE
jgi:hypothetical protein